jgi:hypothetical protein
MEVLDGAVIFWLIAIGMVAGALTSVSIWKNGVKLVTNLVGGVSGSLVVGIISIMLEFPGSLVFGFVGSLAVLFILNVFHLQPEAAH